MAQQRTLANGSLEVTKGIRRALILCFPFIAVDLVLFGNCLALGCWIVDHRGVPTPTDFNALWTAGQLTRFRSRAYDLPVASAAQAALTHTPAFFYPFNYPPHFLLFLAPLSSFPYAIAFALFILATGWLYMRSVVAIAGTWKAAIPALAMPGFLACLIVGQTGCLAAALAGFTLLAAERRPNVSGLALAGLTFKPQFGPLFPVVMALEGRWRVIAIAVGTTAAALATSYWLFGPGVFTGFIAAISLDASNSIDADVPRMQSIYGVARSLGVGVQTAWIMQFTFALLCIVALVLVHRRSRSQSLRNAALLACALLFTPHVLVYDLVMVSPVVAFLWRDKPLLNWEWYALAMAAAVTYFVFFHTAPFGVALPLTSLGMILARVFRGPKEGNWKPDDGSGELLMI